MHSFVKTFEKNGKFLFFKCKYTYRCQSSATPEQKSLNNSEDGEFRVLNLRQTQLQTRTRRKSKEMGEIPSRFNKMSVDQDWGSVWPGPRSFHPAAVPLPVRQGYTDKGAPPPSKYGNAELMKIPNFLHLTPPVIKRQCEAIKKFCSSWPEGLETEEKWKQHFPIEIITSDYCQGLPTIRNPLARIVSVKIKLSALKLDQHAKDKFLRLVGDRYNHENDIVTIVTDRCPLRKQNYDYAQYLLAALYHESCMKEPWEDSKSEADMEYYSYERNKSKISCEAILNWNQTESEAHIQANKSFIDCLETLINEGENEYNIQKYKNEVKKMLGISL